MSYTTVELVAAQLGTSIDASSTPSSSDVSTWIEEADAEIDARTGLTFEPEVFSNEIYDWEGNDNLIRVSSELVSVSTLEYNNQNAGETPVWTSKTEDVDFFLYGDSGEIEINTKKFSPIPGHKRFKLSGTKGKASVPKEIQRLATLTVGNRVVETVVQNQAYANSGGDVQVGTIKVGNPSAFSISGVNAAKSEIENLYTKVIGDFRAFRVTRAYDL